MLALILVSFPLSGALAHKVNMFAFAEGERVFVEGYFSDGKRAQRSEVVVFDASGREVARGVTDDEGSFAFPVPAREDLRITLNAGMGHMAEYMLPAAELGSGAAAGTGGGAPRVEGAAPGEGASAPASSVDVDRAGAAGLERAVRKAVGEAIVPLVRRMSALEERRSFSDIVGGIGFIVGIAGVFFYVKARKMVVKASRDHERTV